MTSQIRNTLIASAALVAGGLALPASAQVVTDTYVAPAYSSTTAAPGDRISFTVDGQTQYGRLVDGQLVLDDMSWADGRTVVTPAPRSSVLGAVEYGDSLDAQYEYLEERSDAHEEMSDRVEDYYDRKEEMYDGTALDAYTDMQEEAADEHEDDVDAIEEYYDDLGYGDDDLD